MIPVLIFVIVVLCWLSVCFRVCVFHPVLTVGYAIKDLYEYIVYKQWRIPQTGRIYAYLGMFRSGKTLSGVAYVVDLIKQYDGLRVYDKFRKKWVTQKIHVVSNVEFKDENINSEYLKSLEQVSFITDTSQQIDEENDTLTIHVIFLDEAGSQMNSRYFKSNMDPEFINSLLTLGHVYMLFIYATQEFTDADALLRRVTSYCISCEKRWRVMIQRRYLAKELENAANPLDVQPLKTIGWFIRDEHYNAYDTHALVENLKKSFNDGDRMTEAEIMALRYGNAPNMDVVQKPSKSYLRRRKKMNK